MTISGNIVNIVVQKVFRFNLFEGLAGLNTNSNRRRRTGASPVCVRDHGRRKSVLQMDEKL